MVSACVGGSVNVSCTLRTCTLNVWHYSPTSVSVVVVGGCTLS